MQNTIYLSNSYINITRGKVVKSQKKLGVSLKSVNRFEVPTGAVVNGVITDEELLYSAFLEAEEVLRKYKDITLVIDTTHVLFKVAVMPVVGKFEILKLIKNEFVNRSLDSKDYVYNYVKLPSKGLDRKQMLVLCCAVERQIIDTYKAFFKRLNLNVSKIEFSTNAILQTLLSHHDFQNKTAVVCIVDNFLVSMINIQSSGEIAFHRSRIVSTKENEGYFEEVADAIYSFMQGSKATNREAEVNALYIYDTNVYDVIEYRAVTERFGLSVVEVGIGVTVPVYGEVREITEGYLYNICVTFNKGKNVLNLLECMEIKPASNKLKVVVIGSLCVLIVAGAMFYLLQNIVADTKILNQEIAQLNMYLNAKETKDAINEHGRETAELESLREVYEKLLRYDRLVSRTYVLESKVLLETLANFSSEIEVYSVDFSSEGGYFEVYMGMAENNIAVFIERLRGLGLFDDVAYMGYTRASKEENFRYSVTCYVLEVKAND